ncbi:MAG: TonB-dependent receptor [Bacteroidota bacterium]
MSRTHIIAITILLALFQFNLAGRENTDAGITGDVLCDGEHVPFINITLDGTSIGTTTDATGHFQLNNLPIGTFTVRVSGIGYKGTTRKITTMANQTRELRFTVTEDVLHMEEVVVSADRNQTNRREAPVVITSVSPSLLIQTQSTNIAEGLSFTPGIRTENNCSNCGFTQLRMNGLDGPYTQILVNSRPVFSGLAGIYGLELIPANMVERIEVVRGGGSALFGGNAIAGTVNVITKESKINSFSLDGRYGIIGAGNPAGTVPAGDAQVNLNASVVTDDQNTGAYVYGMHRDRDPFDENGDGFSEMVTIENTTFGFNAYHKPGARSKITLDGYRIDEFRRGGNKLDNTPHEADLAEQVEHLITGGNLGFDLFTNEKYDRLSLYVAAQGVDRDSYYGAMQDPNSYGHTDDFTSSAGGQYVINADEFLFAASSTVFGIDNNTNLIHDKKLGAGGKDNSTLTHQLVNTLGTFVQQDWKGDQLNLSFGVRFDNYMIRDLASNEPDRQGDYSNMVLLPRISALYKITPTLRWRTGYGMGYRAPQVFSEDLHIELINAKQVKQMNDENLVQETSHSLTTSLNSNFVTGGSLHDLLVEGFFTLLNDPFADEYYQIDSLDTWAYMRVNAADGAYVTGVNMELNSFWTDHLTSQVGFTIQKSEYQSPQAWGDPDLGHESERFMRTPNAYGYASLDWNPVKNFSAMLTLNYTGSMWVPHFGLTYAEDPEAQDPLEKEALDRGDVIEGERLERSEQFLITDLLFSYDLKLSKEATVQLYVGVKNLFNQTQAHLDRGVFRDAGYIYGPYQSRTMNFGLRIGNIL